MFHNLASGNDEHYSHNRKTLNVWADSSLGISYTRIRGLNEGPKTRNLSNRETVNSGAPFEKK